MSFPYHFLFGVFDEVHDQPLHYIELSVTSLLFSWLLHSVNHIINLIPALSAVCPIHNRCRVGCDDADDPHPQVIPKQRANDCLAKWKNGCSGSMYTSGILRHPRAR